MRLGAPPMRKRNEDVIVDLSAGAHRSQLGVDLAHGAKQGKSLVNQMRAEVIEQAARFRRSALLAPGVDSNLRSPPLEMGFETVDLPELAAGDELRDGQHVAVPTAGVEDAARAGGGLR